MSSAPSRPASTATQVRRLRVGIIGTRGVPNHYGGFERFIELLVDEPHWQGTGIEFVVYGEAGEGRYNACTTLVKVHVLKREHPLVYYVQSAWLAARDCDVILCCGVALSTFAFIPRLRSRVLVVNPDGCEWRRTKWPWWIRLIVRAQYAPALWAAHHIVVDAEALRADFGLKGSRKCSYIGYQAPAPESVALQPESRAKLGLARDFVLVIARLEPENNIVMALEAFARLNPPDVDCIVVAPTNTPHYHRVLAPLASSSIRFVGGIFDQQVLNELRSQCVAYIHGHSVGGTNPSLLEALSKVTGALLCHRNKYNEEVAGSEAHYFSDSAELADHLGAALRSGFRRTPSRDQRFHPDEIARRYRELFLAHA